MHRSATAGRHPKAEICGLRDHLAQAMSKISPLAFQHMTDSAA
jgi:hypothetical protein